MILCIYTIYILYLYKYTIIYIHALSIIYSDIPSWGAMRESIFVFAFRIAPSFPYLLQLPDFEARADHALLRVNPRRQWRLTENKKTFRTSTKSSDHLELDQKSCELVIHSIITDSLVEPCWRMPSCCRQPHFMSPFRLTISTQRRKRTKNQIRIKTQLPRSISRCSFSGHCGLRIWSKNKVSSTEPNKHESNGLLKMSLQKTVVGSNCPQLRWRHVKVETLRHANMASRGGRPPQGSKRIGAERKTTFVVAFPFQVFSTANFTECRRLPKG